MTISNGYWVIELAANLILMNTRCVVTQIWKYDERPLLEFTAWSWNKEKPVLN